MSINYLTGALLALLGGFVVVATQAFTADVLSWLAFGVAAAIISVIVLAQLDRSRGWVQRGLDVATLCVSGLMLAFAIAESGSTVIWLSFAFALGIVALAFAGLTVHEVADWNAQYEVRKVRPLVQPQGSMGAVTTGGQAQAA
jgi:hypothetical protein